MKYGLFSGTREAFIKETWMGHSCDMTRSAAASHPKHPAQEESGPQEVPRMGTGRQLLDVTPLPFGIHMTGELTHLLVPFLPPPQTCWTRIDTSTFIPLLFHKF